MPVLVFLIDTSASMNQRTHLGTSLLDIAKGAVETFMKLRLRDQASRTDRYMLVTCDESPATIKAGWKENPAVFMTELKNLQATGLTNLGHALKMTFDLLNVNRLYSGIDNYGQVLKLFSKLPGGQVPGFFVTKPWFSNNYFRRLFEELNKIQGDMDTKYLFIESIINEAKRFRRKTLIGMLEMFRSSMVTFEKKQSLGSTGSNHVR
nr:integrator complex subunit 6-like [Lytechinus pictus]